jgi:sugar phosphate isomerase/epimerase
MQTNLYIKEIKMLKIGLSVNGVGAKALDADNLRKMKSEGIEALEISLGRDLSLSLDYDKLEEAAKAAQIELWSFHLPFMPFEEIDVSSTDAKIRSYSVAMCSDMIKKGTAIGIKKFVIHPSGEPIKEEDRAARIAAAKTSLAELCEVAAIGGATLCVENLPRTCLGRDSSDILELISADPRLRVCFDTNHLLKEDISHFIRAVGDKILTIHVSDYDRLNERHWLAGEGCIDWQSLYSELIAFGYSGAWLYELNLEASPSIIRPRDLCFSDFKNNAEEIFAGKAPTAIGTPAEGLTGWK